MIFKQDFVCTLQWLLKRIGGGDLHTENVSRNNELEIHYH